MAELAKAAAPSASEGELLEGFELSLSMFVSDVLFSQVVVFEGAARCDGGFDEFFP